MTDKPIADLEEANSEVSLTALVENSERLVQKQREAAGAIDSFEEMDVSLSPIHRLHDVLNSLAYAVAVNGEVAGIKTVMEQAVEKNFSYLDNETLAELFPVLERINDNYKAIVKAGKGHEANAQRLEQVNAELNEAQRILAQKNKELEAGKTKVQEDYKSLEQQISGLRKEKETAEASLSVADANLEQAKSDYEVLETAHDALKESKEGLVETNKIFDKRVKAAEEKAGILDKSFKELTEEYATLETDKKNLTELMESYKKDADDFSAKYESEEKARKAAEKQAKSFKDELDELQTVIDAYQTDDEDESASRIERLTSILEGKGVASKAVLEAVETMKKTMEEHAEQTSEQYEDLKSKIGSASEGNTQPSGSSDGAKVEVNPHIEANPTFENKPSIEIKFPEGSYVQSTELEAIKRSYEKRISELENAKPGDYATKEALENEINKLTEFIENIADSFKEDYIPREEFEEKLAEVRKKRMSSKKLNELQSRMNELESRYSGANQASNNEDKTGPSVRGLEKRVADSEARGDDLNNRSEEMQKQIDDLGSKYEQLLREYREQVSQEIKDRTEALESHYKELEKRVGSVEYREPSELRELREELRGIVKAHEEDYYHAGEHKFNTLKERIEDMQLELRETESKLQGNIRSLSSTYESRINTEIEEAKESIKKQYEKDSQQMAEDISQQVKKYVDDRLNSHEIPEGYADRIRQDLENHLNEKLEKREINKISPEEIAEKARDLTLEAVREDIYRTIEQKTADFEERYSAAGSYEQRISDIEDYKTQMEDLVKSHDRTLEDLSNAFSNHGSRIQSLENAGYVKQEELPGLIEQINPNFDSVVALAKLGAVLGGEVSELNPEELPDKYRHLYDDYQSILNMRQAIMNMVSDEEQS